MQLILSLAVLAHLAACLEVAGGLKEKAIVQSDDEGEGRHPIRHHSHDHHDHHHHHPHRRHRHRHRRHHSHDHDHDHKDCPPCDLSVCTSKFGNFTVITRPVTWDQAPNSCAMIGLRLARINIENFMDATNAAFKCSGPFSQSWVHSWNGDAYGGKGLVLSTGNAAPGGAINEVVDCNAGRNVVCESTCEPVKRPDCNHDRRESHCGCNRPSCQCGKKPMPRPEPVLHSKMKCLRCFCRRNAECPLQGSPPIGPTGIVPPITPSIPRPTSTRTPTTTRGRPTQLPGPPAKAAEQKNDIGAAEEKQVGAVEKALNAVGRFIQIPNQKDQAQEKSATDEVKKEQGGDDEEDLEDGEGDEGEDEEDYDEEADQEDYEVEQVVFDNDSKSLEKGFPFMPETCGAQCVCYACKDYEPERHHHRRCHRRRSHHHRRRCSRDRVFDRNDSNDDLKKAAVQLQSLRQIVAFDETGKQVDQKAAIDADQDLKIQIL